ncbi:MAG: thioesterase family protein [Actinobacteria bacterium]|nr:thioesterase family protein [Actinomycetota bacterium]MCB9412404.1 thioesterase family protein [Actinomycetota bacterium]
MSLLTRLWTTSGRWEVPEGWRQGRGAWGGLVVGQIVTAATHGVPELLQPRSVWVSMLAPVRAGVVRCEVKDLRAGKSTLIREVNLVDADDSLLTRAVVGFGAHRDPTAVSDPPAAPADPAPTPGTVIPIGPPVAPEFTGNLRFAPVVGIPYSGASELATSGWVGLPKEAEEPLSTAVVAALSDAWWTTSIVGLDGATMAGGPPPVATLDFALSFPEPPVDEPDVWETGLWHTGRVIGGNDGYLTEIRTLHSPGGRLLAVNTQLQAIGGTGSRTPAG